MSFEIAKDIATRQHVTGHLLRKEEAVGRELGTSNMKVIREFISHMQDLDKQYELDNNKY